MTDDAIVLVLPGATQSSRSETVRLRFDGASAGTMVGEEPAGPVHYLRGRDTAAWVTNVPTYSRVRRAKLFPGIDLIYYGNGRRLEYDLEVSPGGDPGSVAFTVEGGGSLSLAENGDLVVRAGAGELRLAKPAVYQDVDGARHPLEAGYRLGPSNEVRFDVQAFDATRTLVIDPVIVFSTYVGGSGSESPTDVAIDAAGNLYLTGNTTSVDFPLQGALQGFQRGTSDIFVTKVDPTGTRILYSTYLGGSAGDVATSLAVNASGQTYLLGYTTSTDFPLMQPLQTDLRGGQTVFVSKLSTDGSALLYSTYFGDGGISAGIALDAAESVWITGNGALVPATRTFIAKLSVGPLGSALLFATSLGGAALTRVNDIDIGPDGTAFVVGLTGATDFPVVNALQNTPAGGPGDAFVTKFVVERSLVSLFAETFDAENAGAPAQPYAPFASWSVTRGAVDLAGAEEAIGAGEAGLLVRGALDGTDSSLESLTTLSFSPTVSTVPIINSNVYRLELDLVGPTASGTGRVTVRIGTVFAETFSLAGDRTVTRLSREFAVSTATTAPITLEWAAGDAPAAVDGVRVARVAEAPTLGYSTFLGGTGEEAATGIAVDAGGSAHVVGYTTSADFPIASGIQPAIGGGSDAFVARLSPTGSTLLMSTFLGGMADDAASAIDVDAEASTLVAGNTTSADFPVLDGVQVLPGGFADSFVAKIRPDRSLAYSTYVGGNLNEDAVGIAVDGSGSAYIAIQTTSINVPIVNALQADNAGSNDIFLVKLSDASQPQVFGLTQTRGGNTGIVGTTIKGVNLTGVIGIRLVGGLTEIGASSFRASGVTSIDVTFDLIGAAPGTRDLLVVFGDGRLLRLSGAFSVVPGGRPEPWVRVVGRESVRVGVFQTVSVVVGNSGSVDAFGVPVWIEVPVGIEVRRDFALAPPPPPPIGPVFTDEEIGPIEAPLGDTTLFPLFLPRLPAGTSISLPLRVKPLTVGAMFALRVSLMPVLLSPLAGGTFAAATALGVGTGQNDADAFTCTTGVLSLALDVVAVVAPCLTTLAALLVHLAEISVLESDLSAANQIYDLNDLLAGATSCLISLLPNPIRLADALDKVMGALFLFPDVLDTADACARFFGLREPSVFVFRVVGAIDPNEKTGPTGPAETRFITNRLPGGYGVFFENLSTATARAASVVVEDQLDTSILDPRSVLFGALVFGDHVVGAPVAGPAFSTAVDLRPVQNLIVRIDGSANPTTGLLRWEFQAIDPSTGLPPDDPLAGFLPPNVNGAEGTGSVFFTVQAHAGVPTGTQVNNSASIVFDANAPIVTNTWSNTIDNDPPISQVASAGSPLTNSFSVTWAGTDVGSGIRDFTVFASEDDGEYEPWLLNTTATAATFVGRYEHRYSFYSVARDLAGNIEAPPTGADASLNVTNAAPTAANGTLAATEDTATPGLLGASDPNGQLLTYSLVTLPTRGSVTLTPTTGAYVYTPAPDVAGADSFTFQVSDGMATSAVATVAVTITGTNDAPVAANLATTVPAGASVNGILAATDVDGDALNFTLTANGTRGTAVITNAVTGAFTYTATFGASGADTFSFRASDASTPSNTATVTVSITPAASAPDLILMSVSSPATTKAVVPFVVSTVVGNTGTATAGASVVRFYLSADDLRDAADLSVAGLRVVHSLTAAKSSSGPSLLSIPPSAIAGTYRLLACADDTSVVAEGNEANNCTASSTPVTLTAPDLTVTSLTNPPVTLRRGATFSIGDVVVNHGGTASPASIVRYFLSTDAIHDVSDADVGSRAVGTVVPQLPIPGVAIATVPSGMTPGRYLLLACADADGAVAEGNEANNCRVSSGSVVVR